MTRKHTLAALITATALLTNASAANAWGWNMFWFSFGASPGGIVLNGTSFTGTHQDAAVQRTAGGVRFTSVRMPDVDKTPAPAGPVPMPYPG